MTTMHEHARTFYITILIILIVVFIVGGFRFVTDRAHADPAVVSSVHVAVRSAEDAVVQRPPLVDWSAGLVRELQSDTNIYAINDHMRWPLASITKLMTAVVALETLGSNQVVTVSQTAVDVEGVAGGLTVGRRYTTGNLIIAMMTVSSNDAATALAETYDQSVETPEQFTSALSKTAYFVDAMNQKAVELGMNETVFGDSTGLSMVSQSSAVDLQKLIRYVVATHPEVLEITRHLQNTVRDAAGKSYDLRNINALAGRPDFLGGKTGHTDQSLDNLVSLFEFERKTYVIVVFGAQDRFKETETLLTWLEQR